MILMEPRVKLRMGVEVRSGFEFGLLGDDANGMMRINGIVKWIHENRVTILTVPIGI